MILRFNPRIGDCVKSVLTAVEVILTDNSLTLNQKRNVINLVSDELQDLYLDLLDVEESVDAEEEADVA